MAGIYIHIPYCRTACHYCNFHFSTTRYNAPEMLDCLLREIELQKDYLSGSDIQTIYFGGGTPSILPAEWIALLIQKIRAVHPVTNGAELTLEANPDDINIENLAIWQEAGINRLSIGVQSFIEEDLKWMHRAHNATEASTAISLATKAGIQAISLDLIYGTPYLSNEDWLENLNKARDLGIQHLSAYALTVEPSTALFKMIQKGKIPPVAPEKQSIQFDLLMDWADLNGFEHYEISNLALPGHRSRHNSSYWQGIPYLGLGPAAHSYNGKTRKWNIENNPLYIKAIKSGDESISTKEVLTKSNQINETIMIELRMMEGLDLTAFKNRFGENRQLEILSGATEAINRGQAIIKDNRLILTRKGKHFADSIASDLFVD